MSPQEKLISSFASAYVQVAERAHVAEWPPERQDAFQDSAEDFWKYLINGTLPPEVFDEQGEPSISTLAAFLLNRAAWRRIDDRRKRRPDELTLDAPVQLEDGEGSGSIADHASPSPEEVIEAREERRLRTARVARALAAADAVKDGGKILRLLHCEECPFEEIAKRLGIPSANAAKQRAHRARREARIALQGA